MAAAAIKLDVNEHRTRGFFDPMALCVPHLLDTVAHRHPAGAEAAAARRRKSPAEEAYAKRRAVMRRVRDAVNRLVPRFVSEHAGVEPGRLQDHPSKNLPIGVHAVLIHALVREMFPRGGAYVADADARDLASRAPALPGVDVFEVLRETGETRESRGGESRGGDDSDPSRPGRDDDGDDDGDAAGEEDGPVAAGPGPSIWWTSAASGDDVGRFPRDLRPPWCPSSAHRHVRFALPFEVRVTVDSGTGYARVNELAESRDKRVWNWLRLASTEALARVFARDLDVAVDRLAYSVSDGPHRGTWVHVDLVPSLAAWCSPEFAAHASRLQLRYYAGTLTTEESRAARDSVAATASRASPPGVAAATPTPAASRSAQKEAAGHKAARAELRRTARRSDDDARVRDVAVPRHLLQATGCYMGCWGVVDGGPDVGDAYHLKAGKAVDQPVNVRARAHYNEPPHTFALVFVVGCDAAVCALVEETMKRALRRFGLSRVGGSDEEFLVPVALYDRVVGEVVETVYRKHADVIARADRAPVEPDVEIERVRADARVRERELELRYALLESLLASGDPHVAARVLQIAAAGHAAADRAGRGERQHP